jgi:hypothetical protein
LVSSPRLHSCDVPKDAPPRFDILSAEGDAALVQRDESAVGDRNVSAGAFEVFCDLLPDRTVHENLASGSGTPQVPGHVDAIDGHGKDAVAGIT